VPAGWKLLEEGAKVFAQAAGRVDESFHSFFGIMQLFHVGEVAAGLDGKAEARVGGDLFGPGVELFVRG